MSDLTVGEKYKVLIEQVEKLDNNPNPKNFRGYQSEIQRLIKEFKSVFKLTLELDLFSENEFIEEVNVNYLPFLNIDYYLGVLYMDCMSNEKLEIHIDFKPKNLDEAKAHFENYINRLTEMELMTSLQTKQFKGYQLNREEKIQQYRYEKELTMKIANVDNIKDEDEKRSVYLDQINLLIIKTLNHLQMLDMELKVLKNRPKILEQSRDEWNDPQDNRVQQKQNDNGFTTRLESLPQNIPVNKLINNGKVLQPFTLTRQDLKAKVFGTGQVLPSMTVEEYLDYELQNGKMLKPEEPQPEERDTDDEDEELRKREWDDWKDANPKGIGNTQNLG